MSEKDSDHTALFYLFILTFIHHGAGSEAIKDTELLNVELAAAFVYILQVTLLGISCSFMLLPELLTFC